jgi:hypothetical protein
LLMNRLLSDGFIECLKRENNCEWIWPFIDAIRLSIQTLALKKVFFTFLFSFTLKFVIFPRILI